MDGLPLLIPQAHRSPDNGLKAEHCSHVPHKEAYMASMPGLCETGEQCRYHSQCISDGCCLTEDNSTQQTLLFSTQYSARTENLPSSQ